MKKLLIITGVILSLSSAGYGIEQRCPTGPELSVGLNKIPTKSVTPFLQQAVGDKKIPSLPPSKITFPSLTLKNESPSISYTKCTYTGGDVSIVINISKKEK